MKLPVDQLPYFYEHTYERDLSIVPLLDPKDFMYGQVIDQIRGYISKARKVLDLGCNTGMLSLYIAKHGREVIGIDVSRGAIEAAKKSCIHHRIGNAQFFSMDFLKDWTEKRAFDFVLSNHVIEHVPDDQIFLRKIAETMQAGGYLVLMTPTVYSIVYLWHKILGLTFAFDHEVGHLRRYRKEELVELIQSTGFRVTKIVFLDSPLRELVTIPKSLRRVQVIFRQPGIRTIVNRLDAFVAPWCFPATICIHAQRI